MHQVVVDGASVYRVLPSELVSFYAGYAWVATSRPGVNLRSAKTFQSALPNTSLHDLKRLCTGKRLFVRRAREATLQVPKQLLGYSKYLKLHSLFSPKAVPNNPLHRSSTVAKPGSESEPKKHGAPVPRALVIDYNVGDGGSA